MPAISFFATAQGLEVSMLDNFADTKRLLLRIWSQDVIIANSCEPERGIIRAYFYVKLKTFFVSMYYKARYVSRVVK